MSIIRKCYKNGVQHVCQKSYDNGIIFYSNVDYIVFFTLLCVKATQKNLSVLAICLMLNHFHIEASFPNKSVMSSFMNGLTSSFARMYNKQYKLSDKVFKKPFRNAPKYSDKKVRDNFIYIANNPVEKKAVSKAEEYRWNFIKYMESQTPFSEPLNPLTASKTLLSLMRKVKTRYSRGWYLDYSFFRKGYDSLIEKERLQLIDFIVSTYNVIDKDLILSIYGSVETAIQAMNSVSGSEYDMTDDYSDEDYRHYYKMVRIAKREGYDLRKIRFNPSESDKYEEMRHCFRNEVSASEYEIAKFLHTLSD